MPARPALFYSSLPPARFARRRLGRRQAWQASVGQARARPGSSSNALDDVDIYNAVSSVLADVDKYGVVQ